MSGNPHDVIGNPRQWRRHWCHFKITILHVQAKKYFGRLHASDIWFNYWKIATAKTKKSAFCVHLIFESSLEGFGLNVWNRAISPVADAALVISLCILTSSHMKCTVLVVNRPLQAHYVMWLLFLCSLYDLIITPNVFSHGCRLVAGSYCRPTSQSVVVLFEDLLCQYRISAPIL